MVKRIIPLFCIFLLGAGFQSDNTPIQFSFEKFPYSDKLPSNSVIRIYNDKEGYMWFGTKDGLCRFDGYDVKIFKSSALTPGKLTNNEIQCIAEDNDNNLWVGTLEGIFIIDKKNYSIRQFEHKYIDKEVINSILPDSKGYMWVGTSSYGVLRIDPKTGLFERYSMDADSPLKLKGNNVIHIYEDNSNKIWLSLWKGGLCYVDSTRKKIIYAPSFGNNNNPFRFFQDKDGQYWVCTWGDGIFNLTLNNSKIVVQPIVVSKKSEKKADDIVYSITQDEKYGFIWVVTFDGLSLIKKEPDGTCSITDAESYFDEGSNKLFHEIIKDRLGNLWIGSVGEGLYKLDFNKLAIQNIPLNQIKNTLKVPSYIVKFSELSDGDIYLAINRIGLFRFDQGTNEVIRPINPAFRNIRSITSMINIAGTNTLWLTNEGEDLIYIFNKNKTKELDQVDYFSLKNTKSPSENTIITMFEDSKGNVWIGASDGLYLKPLNAPVKLVSSKLQYVMSISEDSRKNIWIGTGKEGVFVCKQNKTDYGISKINLSIGNYQSYSIQSICCTKNGDVYIGTKEGCIYYYDQHKQQATDISGLYGITDEGIMDILEDDYGILWISTIKRIIRYNPKTHAATYYSSADGMLITMFFKDSRIKLKSGQLLFGGNKGICVFNPSSHSISLKPKKQLVLVSDILIQNKSVFDDNLNEHYNSEKKRVTLNHNESNLSIEFSALDYSSANKIQYAYMLSGVDNSWIYVGNNRRFVNYANLPAGGYTFMVKASDENGLWSDQITSLKISILPPPYKTWWAYLLYFSFIAGITYFTARMVINRIRLRNELKISHIEKEKSEELAQIKLRYFTNISHELLTPLTIIMLLIEKLQKKNTGDSAQYEMIKSNAKRLKRLIQQILVFRKTESGNLKLKIKENDIVAFVNNICHSNFHPLVIEKKIHFTIDTERESYAAWFDPDKLDKVLYNLLSNAFKYTPRGGEISVKMSFIDRQSETILRLSVCDSGSGISEEDLPQIFQRFFTSSKSDPSQSHGIGLSLTNDLIQLHKGKIEVKSQLGEGSVFTIELPVSKASYALEEFAEIEEIKPAEIPEIPDIIITENADEIDELPASKDYAILVVEDNRELNQLIVENFSKKYHVFSAENGLQGLEIIKEHEVDLIISDVMMPEMDGLTFCRKVKNNIATSHIGVLMLTAKNSTEDRIECYNAGADAYISKPFEFRVLVARAKNLLGNRKEKTESFQTSQEINISSMNYGSIDEEFLKQAVLKVEAKLADVLFDFDQFAIDLGTSKSTLHRKLKSLTGLAPGEFIRNIRLKHASQMILKNSGNISDVAYAVGFNDPKYFAKCFKAEFGLTPTEYLETKRNSNPL